MSGSKSEKPGLPNMFGLILADKIDVIEQERTKRQEEILRITLQINREIDEYSMDAQDRRPPLSAR